MSRHLTRGFMRGHAATIVASPKMRILSLSSMPESNRQKSLYSSGKAKFLSVQVMAALLLSLFFCFCLFTVLFNADRDGMENWPETSSTVATCVALTAEWTESCSFLAVNFTLPTVCRASGLPGTTLWLFLLESIRSAQVTIVALQECERYLEHLQCVVVFVASFFVNSLPLKPINFWLFWVVPRVSFASIVLMILISKWIYKTTLLMKWFDDEWNNLEFRS